MSSAQSRFTEKIDKQAVLLFLGLIVAGLIGNYFKFHVLNLHFVFGSIFAMLALQILGLRRGIIAAVLISSYTYFEWNHPYAMLTMTLEVAVVGFLSRRWKLGFLTADVLYWLVIGIPVGFSCFIFIMQLPSSGGLFLMMKQAANGIFNVLIARLIYTVYSIRLRTLPVTFREAIANLLGFFVLISILILLIVSSQFDLVKADKSIRISLSQDARRITKILENWLEEKELEVVNLARIAANHPVDQMQIPLDLTKTSDSSLLRIALLDKAEKVIAYSPPVDEQGHSPVGISYSDHTHISKLKQTLKPTLSKVVISRFSDPDPVVVMVAPVLANGIYKGAVGALLSFDRIKVLLETNIDGQELLYALLDEDGKVIFSNHDNHEIMKQFSRGKGTLSSPQENLAQIYRPSPLSMDKKLSQWIPELPSNISTIEIWGRSHYVAETNIGKLTEWKLILEQPVAPIQKQLYDTYIERFTLMFVILIIAIVIAEIISHRFARTVENLSVITSGLPAYLEAGKTINWPESRITENKDLINNFREMSISVVSRFDEIQSINKSLEKRVEERTKKLQLNEALIKASLKEKETLLHEIHHRVKNNMTVIVSLLKLQLNKKDKKDVDEVLKENIGRVYSMAAIYESLHQSENLSEIDFKAYLNKMSQMLFQTYSIYPSKVTFQIGMPDLKFAIDLANPFGLVLNELISNSLKYAFPDCQKGSISINSSFIDSKTLELIVADDGIGLPDGFDWRKSDSLGLKLVQDLVENQLGGSIDLDSTNGTKFTIIINLKSNYK